MKTFLHVLNTWTLSILIAVFMLFVCEHLSANSNEWFDSALFMVIFYVMLGGAPSFFISWAFIGLIQKTSYSSYEKLFLWFVAAIVSVVLNIFLLLLAVSETIGPGIFFLFWPAYAGVVVTIILRLKQFFSLVNKTTHHETNMV